MSDLSFNSIRSVGLPNNAYYTPEGAIVFKKPLKSPHFLEIESKIQQLESQISSLTDLVNKNNLNNS